MTYLTYRHQQTQSHQLSQETLASHPHLIGRLLYFLLPYLFAAIINIALFTKVLKIHQNNFVNTFPSNPYIAVVVAVSAIGAGVAGINAVLDDTWTVKYWILFAFIAILIGLKPLIFSADTGATLIIVIFINILSALSNQWFLILLKDLPEGSQGEIGWKHFARNIVGFIQAALVIYTFQHITQSLVHIFTINEKSANYFFWIFAPITTISLLAWNIISFGPILDQIGYIVAAVLLFMGAAVSTLFHKVVDYRESSRQASPRK